MTTIDGRFPVGYTVPRRVEEFLRMPDSELHRITQAYDLDSQGSCYRRGARMDFWSDDIDFHYPGTERRRTLVILFEFLRADRIAEHLRFNRRERMGPRLLTSN